MRVTGLRIAREEDGAVAIVLAISVLMLFSVAALAIDVGLLRVNRRSLATDVDAAAMAVALYARELTTQSASGTCVEATLEPAVRARAVESLTEQGGGSVLLGSEFEFTCTGRYGRVTVAATNDQELPFAPANGNAESVDVYAASSAEFGPIVGAERARPIPLCVEGNGDIQTAYGAWQAGAGEADGEPWLGTSSSGEVYKILLDKTFFNTVCNTGAQSPGNFLWVDFDGDDSNTGKNGRPCPHPDDPAQADKEVTSRLLDGYPCAVFTTAYVDGSTTGPNCRPDLTSVWESDSCPSITGTGGDDVNCIAGKTGGCVDQICAETSKGNPAFDAALWPTAAEDCHHIWTLIIYDQLVPETEGAATHPRLRPVGFVNVVPRWLVNNKKDGRYLAVEFLSLSEGQGVIGKPADDQHHRVLGVRLCGAESEQSCLD